ncbi:MAG: glycine-rich domain-containing protein [Ilumatobacteraceae bacterium]
MSSREASVLGVARPRSHRLQTAIGLLVVLATTPITFALQQPRAAKALVACAEGTHYSRSTNGGGFPITYTFTSTTACTWTVPSGLNKGDFILVGGGGGGGWDGGSGGGGGELRYTASSTSIGSPIDVAVGGGGATGKRALAAIAAEARREGGIVNVTGYARKSPTTSNAFIKKVSERRALVVANYLATLGVQQWIRWQGVGAPTTTTGVDTDRRVVVSLIPYEQ